MKINWVVRFCVMWLLPFLRDLAEEPFFFLPLLDKGRKRLSETLQDACKSTVGQGPLRLKLGISSCGGHHRGFD